MGKKTIISMLRVIVQINDALKYILKRLTSKRKYTIVSVLVVLWIVINNPQVLYLAAFMMIVYGVYWYRSRLIQNRAYPEFAQFITTYRNPDFIWPNPRLSIPSDDIVAFHKLLEMKGYNLPYQIVAQTVQSELQRQQYQHFCEAFFLHNPLVSSKSTPNDLAHAYVKTFQNTLEFIPYLDKLMANNNLGYKIMPRAEKLVLQYIHEMFLESRVKAIENQMITGGYRGTPVNMNYIDAMSGVDFERKISLRSSFP